jgi:hypothetical protein
MSVFQEALAQAEATHKQELAELKRVFQTELESLKQQLTNQQRFTAATSTTSSPVEMKLDLIMQHLQLQPTVSTVQTNETSPPRKRRDNSTAPPSLKQKSEALMEEDQYPGTKLNWDVSSSRDDAMMPSAGSDP